MALALSSYRFSLWALHQVDAASAILDISENCMPTRFSYSTICLLFDAEMRCSIVLPHPIYIMLVYCSVDLIWECLTSSYLLLLEIYERHIGVFLSHTSLRLSSMAWPPHR